MTESIQIRESTSEDWPATESLYPDAFPNEDLLPLVEELLRLQSTTWSFVGTIDGALVAHIVFTECGVAESSPDPRVITLDALNATKS